MITLGIDLHAREARLVALDALKVTHAGTLHFPEGFLSDAVMRTSQPLTQSLQDQLTLWGIQPAAVGFTMPEGLLPYGANGTSLNACSRALGATSKPSFATPRQAVLAALAQEPRPFIAVLVHDGETEVISGPPAGPLATAASWPTPTEDLGLEMWTPEVGGPASRAWLSALVQRVETFRRSSPDAEDIPVILLADHVAFPHLVEAVSSSLPGPVRWAAPWNHMEVDAAGRPVLDTMGPRLVPALGAALTPTQSAKPFVPEMKATTMTPVASPVQGLAQTRPSTAWVRWAAWSSLLVWLPLIGLLEFQAVGQQETLQTLESSVNRQREGVARIEQLETFAQRQGEHLARPPLAESLRQVIEFLPSSLYLTHFQSTRTAGEEAEPERVHLFLQGLTRRPQDVRAWMARVEQQGRFTVRASQFEPIPPRTRFRVTFEERRK